METLYDVQEWLKKYGYVNLTPERLDAIYFMKQEIGEMHRRGLLADDDPNYLAATLVLRREERIEMSKSAATAL